MSWVWWKSFFLEVSEEALDEGVVEAVAFARHGLFRSGCVEEVSPGDMLVLESLIRVHQRSMIPGLQGVSAFSSDVFVNCRLGEVAQEYATMERSNRSITGERQILRSPIRNSVTSVTHFWFGASAVKSRSSRLGRLGRSGL